MSNIDVEPSYSILRDPKEVMNIHRLGSMHQTRLSFVRTFVRLASKHHWKITQDKWEIDKNGYGFCSYRLKTVKNIYHLVIFSNQITDKQRNDRVIAEKWDITFALVLGHYDDFINDLKANVPLQECGRNNNKVIVLSRANKSIRVFEHIVDNLAHGKQPDIEILNKVGYILRTTAVYGNGKFGIQDFNHLSNNEDFQLSFCAQMCALYILREFSFDLIDFLAKQQGEKNASTLCKDYKRYLGIGNATGLGMSLFLIKHPKIVDNWISVRETALSRVTIKNITAENKKYMLKLLNRASLHLKQVHTIDDKQRASNLKASIEIIQIMAYVKKTSNQKLNWGEFINVNRQYTLEAQEVAISCVLELYPQIVDTLQNNMNANENTDAITGVNVGCLKILIEDKYKWAISVDFSKNNNQYWFWYISKNKEEPRLGVRGKDNGDISELPLDIARQISCLYKRLQNYNSNHSLVSFLIDNPNFTTIARRTWALGHCKMGEIRVNTLEKGFLPIDLLRCKLSIFGATKFDPRSDRWVRVTFFQNAPLIDEIDNEEWLFPIIPKAY